MNDALLSSRLSQLRDRVAQAAHAVGRDPSEITLIGVSKRHPIEAMQRAYDAGLRDFGENRAQELRDKFPAFNPPEITRHFIGHLQTNKVRYLPGRVDLIHTIDSRHIAETVNTRFGDLSQIIPCLIEVNISGESSKSGVAPRQAFELAAFCKDLEFIDFQGLMTIGPMTADRERIRQAFREMKLISDQIERRLGVSCGRARLSMGMSDDFEIAIAEGATHIRVGTALFGPREY